MILDPRDMLRMSDQRRRHVLTWLRLHGFDPIDVGEVAVYDDELVLKLYERDRHGRVKLDARREQPAYHWVVRRLLEPVP